jgi:uncharacterized protein YaaN involved in tellurite resistance
MSVWSKRRRYGIQNELLIHCSSPRLRGDANSLYNSLEELKLRVLESVQRWNPKVESRMDSRRANVDAYSKYQDFSYLVDSIIYQVYKYQQMLDTKSALTYTPELSSFLAHNSFSF